MSLMVPYREGISRSGDSGNQEGTVLVVPVPTSLEIREKVNGFLASLPLGTSRRDVQIEDAVAGQLFSLFNTHTDLQLKLNQW